MDLKSSAKDFKQPYTELRENDRVDRARQMVENDPNDIGIVVDDDGFLKGVLTPSDIVLAADLKDQLGKTLKEAGIYKDNVVKCSADDTLEQVLRTMDLSGVKTVVIVKSFSANLAGNIVFTLCLKFISLTGICHFWRVCVYKGLQ